MNKIKIARNQNWKHNISGHIVNIHGKHGDKWVIVRIGGPKRNTTDSHTVSNQTLWRKFTLI